MKKILYTVTAYTAIFCGLTSKITAQNASPEEAFYLTSDYTNAVFVVDGIEGPSVDKNGNLYVMQFNADGKIGITSAAKTTNLFVTLPTGSLGNGSRFDSQQNMFVADYKLHKILKINMKTKAVTTFASNVNMNQPNDIAIGKNDIIYASDPNWSNNTGNLWRVNLNGTTTLLEGNMGTTNGIEVDPTEKILYVNESVQKNIWAYDLSSTGAVSNKRLFYKITDAFGLDGMRTDIDGNLYVARYGKGVIAKFSPAGVLLKEIILKGQNPSNVAFGGTDGKTCFVTLADRGVVETFRVEQPGREWQLANPATTGLKDQQLKDDTYIYPNPVQNGFIKLHVPQFDGKVHVSVSTITGHVSVEEILDVTDDEISFVCPALSAGTYLINVSQGDKVFAAKLLVE